MWPWLMLAATWGPRRRRGGGPPRWPSVHYHSRAAVLRDSRLVHLIRSRIPVWLMTRLEVADENRGAAEIRTLGCQRQTRTDWSAPPSSPAVTTGSHGRGLEPRIRTFVAELLQFRLAGRSWVGTTQENPRAGCKPRRRPREMESTDEGRSVQRVSEPTPDMSARTAARPASSRTTGTRGGEQET